MEPVKAWGGSRGSTITGRVAGAELCTPLHGVLIERRDAAGNALEHSRSDEQGTWRLTGGSPGEVVSFRHEGYVEKTFPFDRVPALVRLLENTLIGYHRKVWFSPGETVAAFVHAPGKYRAELYRHGMVKERILDLGEFERQGQQVPDGPFVETGLDWDRSLLYRIPEDAKPGLYSLLLRARGYEPFALPMVVSPSKDRRDKPPAILVLASTNNWQCYNTWGGRSRYRNFEDSLSPDFHRVSPSRAHVLARGISRRIPVGIRKKIRKITGHLFEQAQPEWYFQRLSILRPFSNCALEETTPFQPFTNHLAAGEWRLLSWLEREGVPYDIVSGVQLHEHPEMLKAYRAIVLSTHCEYWSRDMYDSLKRHHLQNGLWLLNLSGNSLHRLVDFYDDGSIRCTNLWLGRSYDDESQLTGVRVTLDDYGSCAPYKILEPDHWAFHGIPLNRERTFGGLSLNQNTRPRTSRYDPGRPGAKEGLQGMGASGWETDKRTQTAPRDMVCIAKGRNRSGGADMMIREPGGTRGGLFSASSITFGGCLLIDNVASALVKNVLQKALGQ